MASLKTPSSTGRKAAIRRQPGQRPSQLALSFAGPGLVAGVDEAGRGPLVGPVVAAAVILNDQHPILGLADSKVLSAVARERLNAQIHLHAACCSVGMATVEEIEELNILHATMLAMRRAVMGLRIQPGMVLVDGNRLPQLPMPAQAIVGGDASQACISAASIVAKVERDRWCLELHEQFPEYGFDKHKGYPTQQHLQALQRFGPTPFHRRGFGPVRMVLVSRPGAGET